MKKAKKRNFSIVVKLLAIVFSLVTVTFSWFVLTKEGWVNPFETHVTGAVNVVISKDQSNWTDKLVISSEENDYGYFTEFSSNGIHFYTPIIQDKTVAGYFLQDFTKYDKLPYVEIHTFIKTDGKIKLFLSPESTILPSDPENPKDSIAGATRVAMIVENYKPIIWAPNSTYQFNENTNKVIKQGEVEDKYQYVHENNIDDEFAEASDLVTIDNSSKSEAGYIEDENVYFMWGDLSRIDNYESVVTPIFTVNNVADELIVPVTIRVWIEGTDREARGSLVGGKVKMNLKFMSVSIVDEQGGND